VLGGIGGGANATASMAILSSMGSKQREKYIGWGEAACGIGLLFGPLLGAALYDIGGYVMPFATFGKFTHRNY
jgi:MFS family permease